MVGDIEKLISGTKLLSTSLVLRTSIRSSISYLHVHLRRKMHGLFYRSCWNNDVSIYRNCFHQSVVPSQGHRKCKFYRLHERYFRGQSQYLASPLWVGGLTSSLWPRFKTYYSPFFSAGLRTRDCVFDILFDFYLGSCLGLIHFFAMVLPFIKLRWFMLIRDEKSSLSTPS